MLRSILVPVAAAAAVLSALPAQAGVAEPMTVFALPWRQNIDRQCGKARDAADQIADHGANVSAGYAHSAARLFFDCAAQGQVIQDRLNRYFIMAGAAEMIAADRETGAAAEASRRNAIKILTPLTLDPEVSFNEGYLPAPPELGDAAIKPVVQEFGAYQPTRHPTLLGPIASDLIGEAQQKLAAAQATPVPAAAK
jgi:hypothetical protein